MRSYPLPAASGTVGPATAASGSLVGFRGLSISETATTAGAAYVTVREANSTGNIIASVKLAASGSVTFSHNEAVASNGQLYVKYESGTISGALYID